MKLLKPFFWLACLSLVGCASWHKYSYDNPQHQGFESITQAQVPADLSSEQVSSTYYPIPKVIAKDTGKAPSLAPPV